MITLDAEQGSDEWLTARAGLVTASKFADIVTSKGKPTTGAKRTVYMNTLLSESMTGEKTVSFQSDWMTRGIELEPDARNLYGFLQTVDTEQVGLVYLNESKRVACSPDALVGQVGLWENKSPAPHTHVGYLLKNEVPTQYIPQIQGQIWVCDREWCDFMSYCPGLPPLIIRVNRDTRFIKLLSDEVECFVDEMLEKRVKLKAIK